MATPQLGRDDLLMRPTAMIVDDHAGFRAMARLMLEDADFDVVGEAADGAGALASMEALRPRLVLLDVQLPDVDGFTVAEDLARTAPESVVVLTSVRSAADYGDRWTATTSPARFVEKAALSGAFLADLLEGAQ